MARVDGDEVVMDIFAVALRERRRAVGLTQEELGKGAGLGRSYVSRLERGETNPSLTTVCRLAQALETTAATLLADL